MTQRPRQPHRAPALDGRDLRALIVDVDGTLYHQPPMRRAMFWRLLRAYVRAPRTGTVTLRALQAYRRAQETLRAAETADGELASRQVRLASEASGVPERQVAAYVARWMEREPLDLIARWRRPGVLEFLEAARRRGLRLGAFSDYPLAGKLAALEVDALFDVAVCAQDSEVRRFKPHPRGLEVTARRLGVDPAQILCLGDRPETDAVAARAAGMACVILGRRRPRPEDLWIMASGYPALTDLIGAV